MAGQPDIVVYSLELCPNCDQLKEYLARSGFSFRECDMSSAESLTELRVNGIFVQEAPVLQVGRRFLTHTDLFSAGTIREDRLRPLLMGD